MSDDPNDIISRNDETRPARFLLNGRPVTEAEVLRILAEHPYNPAGQQVRLSESVKAGIIVSGADMLRVHMDSAAHLLKECLRLQNENEQLRALVTRLAQGEVISYGGSIGDPVYFCSHCDPDRNEHEPACPILQARVLGVEVTE